MKKIIIKCKNCNRKMKIMDKAAKYKCPYCQKITNFKKIDRVFYKTRVIVKDGIDTFIQLFAIISQKLKGIFNHIKK